VPVKKVFHIDFVFDVNGFRFLVFFFINPLVAFVKLIGEFNNVFLFLFGIIVDAVMIFFVGAVKDFSASFRRGDG